MARLEDFPFHLENSAMDGSAPQDGADALVARTKPRSESISQQSDNSQTAAEYVAQFLLVFLILVFFGD